MDLQVRSFFLKSKCFMCSSESQSRATQSKTAWLCTVCSHQRLKVKVLCMWELCWCALHRTPPPSPIFKIWKMSHHSSSVISGKGQGTQSTDLNRNIVRHCFFWTVLYFRRILQRAKQPAQHFVCLSHRRMDLIVHQGTCFSSSREITDDY